MRVLRYIHENFPTSNAINSEKQKEIPEFTCHWHHQFWLCGI